MDKLLFVRHATPLVINVGTRQVALMPRLFRTGSVGWFGNGSTTIDELPVQYTITLVVKDSREGEAVASAAAVTSLSPPAKSPGSQGAPGRVEPSSEDVTPPSLFETPPGSPQEPEGQGTKRRATKKGPKS